MRNLQNTVVSTIVATVACLAFQPLELAWSSQVPANEERSIEVCMWGHFDVDFNYTFGGQWHYKLNMG